MEETINDRIDELNRLLMIQHSIPAHLLEGSNYASSRVALEVFCNRLGLKVEYTDVGGTWLGEVQSP